MCLYIRREKEIKGVSFCQSVEMFILDSTIHTT